MDNQYKKRILFVGMPDMAFVVFNQLINNGFNIVGIIPPDKFNNTFNAMKNLAKNYNLPFLEYDRLDDSSFLKEVKKLKADIGIVCSFNKKLPNKFLETTQDGFLNCHPSLLPKYRGGNPYSAVILNHEQYTGVTIHFMNENFDEGDITSQTKIEIEKNDTMGTLFNRLNLVTAQMVVTTLEEYEKIGYLKSYKQPQGNFIKSVNILPNSYQTFIDWHKSCNEIETLIRALNPFINANTVYKHNIMRVYSCEYEIKQTNVAPGMIIDLSKGLGISCLDGIVHIKSLYYGSYINTTGEDFAKRFSVQIGEKIG